MVFQIGNKINLGKKHTKDTKGKIREHSCRFWLGKKLPEETRKKLSIALMGNKNCLGREVSKETRDKMSKAHKGMKKPWSIPPSIWRGQEGEKNPNWKGGITPYFRKIRNSLKWKIWRKVIFTQNNYTCQKCSARSGKQYDGVVYLEAHHIIPVCKLIKTKFEKYIFDIRNGITLCKACHSKIYDACHRRKIKRQNRRIGN